MKGTEKGFMSTVLICAWSNNFHQPLDSCMVWEVIHVYYGTRRYVFPVYFKEITQL